MDFANFTFEKNFYITTTALRLNRSHPFIKRNSFWVFQFIMILALSATCFGLLLYSCLFYDIPERRYAEASKNGIMSIVALTNTFKYSFLLYFQVNIKDIMDIIDNDYKLAMDYKLEEKEIVIKYAKKGRGVCIYWFIGVCSSGAVFPLKALFNTLCSYLKGEFRFFPMFDLRYPEVVNELKDTPSVFCLLFMLCFMFDIYSSTMYVGFDPLVPIFLLHICGQLDILSNRMTDIFIETDNSEDINEKLKCINIKLQELYRLIKIIISKFTLIYEFIMKTTTFLIPFAMFQVVDDLRRNQLNVEFLTFFVAACLHFYMPCYYSDALMDRSANLRKAIYSCGWEKIPDKLTQKTILLMLTRTTTPLSLSTVFYPITLDTFAEMCRQSYAIFNIMNAACA